MDTSVLLIDDHTLFREALVPVLKELDPGIRVIEASTKEEAISATEYYRNLDLILLDLVIPGCDGLQLLGKLRQTAPDVPLVILSGENDPRVIKRALESGARGYIPKSISTQGLKHALQLVTSGETYVPLELVSGNVVDVDHPDTADADRRSGLTRRQQVVLELLVQGLPNKSIARQLDLSEGTVKLHVSAIFRSLGARNRTEAAREAARRGLLGDDYGLH